MGRQSKRYQLGLYEKAMPSTLSWEEKLELVKASGFDYLEMSIDETDAKQARLTMSKQERLEIVKLSSMTGVKIRSICLSAHRKSPLGSEDPQVQRRSLEIMQQAIDLASDLGIRIIQLAGYDVYYQQGNAETVRNFRKNLKIACEMAAKQGVVLGFETMETPFMDTVEKAMKVVHEMDSPYLGVYPDIGNLKNASVLYGNSLTDDLTLGKGHIFAAHLKETKPGYYREIPFGTGHTDYEACLSVLTEMGVRMFVGEFWYTGSKTWKQDLIDANRFLRERIEKYID